MAKNMLHYETGFGVYRSAQLTPHSFFLLLYLFIGPTLDKNVKFNFKATFINIVYANRTTLVRFELSILTFLQNILK
jgi:hypothetical protein